jgi:hypothetical protein
MSRPDDFCLVMVWALAACYSAEPDGSVTLPFDPASGALRPEVWARWLAWDPVRIAAGHAEALRSLQGVWIDAGRHDEYFLDLGAEALATELRRVGVGDIAFELYEGTHFRNAERYPLAVSYLAGKLAAAR